MTEADAREKLHEILRREGDLDGREYHIAQAILSAFPQIAPREDVVEEARAIAHRATVGCDAPVTEGHIYDCAKLTNWIAAALTAHAAREREAIAATFDERARLLRKRGAGNVTGDMNDELAAGQMDAFAADIRARSTP